MSLPPDEVRLIPGRLRIALGLFILGLALSAVILSGLGVVASSAALLLLVAVALRESSRGRGVDARILVFHPDQTLAIDDDRGRVQADFVIGPAIGLHLHLGAGRTRRLILFRDELDDPSWRRLRARLRHP